MKRRFSLPAAAIAALLIAAFAAAPALAGTCDTMRSRLLRGGGSASGLLVVDAESGRTLCARAPGRPLPLASNMKMFTTAAALSLLGPEHRIPTKLFATGPIDSEGTLHGDLYLRGGGDPMLGTPAFYGRYFGGLGTNLLALRRQVVAAGIEKVEGRLYADDTIFDRLRGVADSGYATSSYIGPLSGLAFNAGFASSSARSFASDPAKLAAAQLARTLRAGGVRVPTQVALAPTPLNAERIGVLQSPPLDPIVNTTNVYSVNFLAEMLIKLLGAQFGSGGTTAAGAKVVADFAGRTGSGVHAVDGSGLTRTNRGSPRQVVDLLLGMREDPAGEEFIQDLALTGREGTVANRTEGTAAYGRCRTKTGTLTGVSALSGYCFNRSGRIVVFSILMASVGSLGLAHYEQDRIAAAVASY